MSRQQRLFEKLALARCPTLAPLQQAEVDPLPVPRVPLVCAPLGWAVADSANAAAQLAHLFKARLKRVSSRLGEGLLVWGSILAWHTLDCGHMISRRQPSSSSGSSPSGGLALLAAGRGTDRVVDIGLGVIAVGGFDGCACAGACLDGGPHCSEAA